VAENRPIAWLAWLGVHLSLLSGAEERTSVFVDWGWNALTRKRGKRIILSDEDVAADAASPPMHGKSWSRFGLACPGLERRGVTIRSPT
jgi:hypothetical protein